MAHRSVSCARSAGLAAPVSVMASAHGRRAFEASTVSPPCPLVGVHRLQAGFNRPLALVQRAKLQSRKFGNLRPGQGSHGCTKLYAAASADVDANATTICEVEVYKAVPFGRALKVVGNHPALGDWNPIDGLELEWSEGDVWKAEVALPPGTWEFKAVEVGNDWPDAWEEGENRIIEVEEEEDTATDAFAQAAAMMAEANGFRPNESLEPIFPESETLDFQPPSPAAPVVYDAQTDTVDLLQQQVRDLMTERDELQWTLESYKKGSMDEADQIADGQASQAASIASALDMVEHAHVAAVQKACGNDPSNQGAMWQLHDQLTSSMREIRAQVADGIPAQSSNFSATPDVEAQVQALKEKLASVQDRGLPVAQISNNAAQLERRIAELEANDKAQKQRWSLILKKTEKLHELEKAEWKLIVEEKDREIRRFRSELDSILRELGQIGGPLNGSSH